MKFKLIAILVTISLSLLAQENDLPKFLTPQENTHLSDFQIFKNGITEPPSSEVRTMAEWEEAQALVVTWTSYTSVLSNIVKDAQSEGKVIIICNNPASVKQNLTANQVDTNLNIVYLTTPFNSVWCRDYGANSVYKNDVDSLYLVDWIYNRPRYKDDTTAVSISKLINTPLYTTTVAPYDLVNTGGNFMTDGSGIAFASKLVLEENGPNNKFGSSNHSSEGVDSIMKRFMGIDQYIKMEILPDDGIHHIDMHMKLLNETTLLVGEYPVGEKDAAQIEANLQYVLHNYKTIFGTDYKVIRIPMPPYSNGTYPGNGFNRTYTNATFFNKTVILPSYETKYDTTALRIWQEALPGYKIAMVNCNSPIQAGGAVHCITKEIGVADPIRIVHQPINGAVEFSTSGYNISAKIQHISGIKSATIYFRTDTTVSFSTIKMDQINQNDFIATFSSFPTGTHIYYYINVVTNNDRIRTHPIPAPDGLWHFYIQEPLNNQEINYNRIKLGTIYPNPASGITCIPLIHSNNEVIDVCLLDIYGRKVKTIFNGQCNQNNLFINANELNNGIYNIILKTKNEIQYQKIVVNK